MLTASAKFSSGQRWPPARRVTVPSPLGGTSFRLGVEREGGGAFLLLGGADTIRGRVGRFRKLRDMAPIPISLGDNKKGMLEKGKQREESTKTKARARSV